MAKKKNPDWTAIKAEYLAGGIGYRKLAEKHGVSFGTLKGRAIADGWAKERERVQHKISTELPAVVAGAILDEALEWVTESKRIARDLRRMLEEKSKGSKVQVVSTKEGPVPIDVPFANSAQDLKAIAETLASLDKTMRQALGLDSKSDDEKDDATLDSLMDALAESRKQARGEQ